MILDTVEENDSEEESESDRELLIDQIARERREGNEDNDSQDDKSPGSKNVSEQVLNPMLAMVTVQAPITPVVEKENTSPVLSRSGK